MALLDRGDIPFNPKRDVIDLEDGVGGQYVVEVQGADVVGGPFRTLSVLPISGQLMRYLRFNFRKYPYVASSFGTAKSPKFELSTRPTIGLEIPAEERNPYDRP